MLRKYWKRFLIVAVAVMASVCMIAALSPVRSRLEARFEQLRVRVFYALFPPEESVFTPQQQEVAGIVQSTMQAIIQATAQQAAPTQTPIPQVDVVTTTPTATSAPLPPSVALSGVRYEDQHGLWNYCAPSTLSMGLSYWGWKGTRLDTGKVLKPFEKDKNVMLYEMAAFVEEHAGLKAALRSGGTLETIKRLVAAGFPVIIEKGTYIEEVSTGRVSWMGHYNVITGYDDATKEFIVQDSYYQADYRIAYDLIEQQWRSFNFMFLVIYPADKQDAVLTALGPYQDEMVSYQIAADTAMKEIASLSGVDRFFAWFNRGTSLVNVQDYAGAALAYDEAFKLYPDLPKDMRPWRMTWYQTGPYFAYFYSGRYQDVIDLATTTLDAASEPFLEESYYWRARARAAVGDIAGAADDLHASLKYHPDFAPSLEVMQQLGIPK